jgi:hypothetical protein
LGQVNLHNFGLALRGSALKWLDSGALCPTNHGQLSSYYLQLSSNPNLEKTHHRFLGQPPPEAQRKGL